MTIRDLGDALIYLGAVAAALSAIGGLLYWTAVRPFRRWLREQIREMRTAAEETRDATNAIQGEVTPNHGSSLKDAVTRTELKVDRLDQRFTDHLTNHPGPDQTKPSPG